MAETIDGADAVINLADQPVKCSYSGENPGEIMHSRVRATRVVAEAIAAATSPPPVWVQMSTATMYPHRFDAAHDEQTGIIGGGELGAPGT